MVYKSKGMRHQSVGGGRRGTLGREGMEGETEAHMMVRSLGFILEALMEEPWPSLK